MIEGGIAGSVTIVSPPAFRSTPRASCSPLARAPTTATSTRNGRRTSTASTPTGGKPALASSGSWRTSPTRRSRRVRRASSTAAPRSSRTARRIGLMRLSFRPRSISSTTSTTASATALPRQASGRATAARCSRPLNICARSTRITGSERSFGDWGLGPDLYGYNVRTRIEGPLNGPGNLERTGARSRARNRRLHLRFERQFPERHGQPRQQQRPVLVGQPGPDVGFGVNDQGAPMFDACYTWGASPELQLLWLPDIRVMRPKSAPEAASTRTAT